MLKSLTLITTLMLASASATLAACPAAVAGTTSEAIRANQHRTLCLQQEIDQNAQILQLELDVRRNENAINRIQLQRRFDALPQPIPSPFTQPAPFAPN